MTADHESHDTSAGHPECSDLEAQVLWEYSKLARVIQRVSQYMI